MRVVLDTSVLVSAIRSKDGKRGQELIIDIFNSYGSALRGLRGQMT